MLENNDWKHIILQANIFSIFKHTIAIARSKRSYESVTYAEKWNLSNKLRAQSLEAKKLRKKTRNLRHLLIRNKSA